MTTRTLIEFYTICLIAGIAAAYYLGPIAGIAAFTGVAIWQTNQSETRRRP